MELNKLNRHTGRYSQSRNKTINSLPNDKILHRFKLKAFADDKINVT